MCHNRLPRFSLFLSTSNEPNIILRSAAGVHRKFCQQCFFLLNRGKNTHEAVSGEEERWQTGSPRVWCGKLGQEIVDCRILVVGNWDRFAFLVLHRSTTNIQSTIYNPLPNSPLTPYPLSTYTNPDPTTYRDIIAAYALSTFRQILPQNTCRIPASSFGLSRNIY